MNRQDGSTSCDLQVFKSTLAITGTGAKLNQQKKALCKVTADGLRTILKDKDVNLSRQWKVSVEGYRCSI
jgi:hypothetical protein